MNADFRLAQGIALCEGELTVRMEVRENDEVTELSEYFNATMEKIGHTV